MKENIFELIFLGTGAADWEKKPAPELRYDREGKIRRSCSLLINGSYLIDPSPESWFFAIKVLQLDLSGLKGIFLTHSHADHFHLGALKKFLGETGRKIDFYCHETTLKWLKLTPEIESRMRLHLLQTDRKTVVGGMSVLPLESNHQVSRTDETTLHYLFSKNERCFFYGCDGGWFLAKTWDLLMKKKLDLVILEATVGNKKANYRIASHNTLPMIELLVASMKECGMIEKESQVVLSHLSKEEHKPGADYGKMKVAFDGMKLTL